MINSGITLHSCIFAALLLPAELIQKPNKRHRYTNHKQQSTWKNIINIQILKMPAFIVLFVNNLMWCIGYAPLTILLPDYAREAGMNKGQGSLLISVAFLGSFIGRILAAFIMNRFPHRDSLHVYNLSTIFGGIMMAMYPLKEVFMMFAINTFAVGVLFGLLYGSLPMVTRELCGAQLFTSSFSYLMIADGIGILVGVPIAGK